MRVRVAVLGSTGSIGTQTLDVVRAEPGRFEVVALGAGGGSVDLLAEQAKADPPRRRRRRRRAGGGRAGAAAATGHRARGRARRAGRRRTTPTSCVNGVVGFAGLPVTLAALGAGRRLALANKESLIAAGPVVQRARPRRAPSSSPSTASTAPCTSACAPDAGGGRAGRAHRAHRQRRPVPGPHPRPSSTDVTHRRRPGPSDLAHGPEDHRRLVHADEQGPRGHRGPRAVRRRLRPDRRRRAPAVDRPLDGRVHRRRHRSPSSSLPDMRLPIGYALAYPDRLGDAVRAHRLGRALPRSTSSRPTSTRSPASTSPTPAGRAGGTAPAWLNAANEVAVAAFLDGPDRLARDRRGTRGDSRPA